MRSRRPTRTSEGERAIIKRLRECAIPFVHDEPDFFEGRPLLRPDVVVESLRLVIEYDGKQHFTDAPGTKYRNYLRNGGRKNDEYKDRACFFASIHLARIPYTVPISKIPEWVDRAVALCRGGDGLLTAYETDYYERPHPLPFRPRT